MPATHGFEVPQKLDKKSNFWDVVHRSSVLEKQSNKENHSSTNLKQYVEEATNITLVVPEKAASSSNIEK